MTQVFAAIAMICVARFMPEALPVAFVPAFDMALIRIKDGVIFERFQSASIGASIVISAFNHL